MTSEEGLAAFLPAWQCRQHGRGRRPQPPPDIGPGPGNGQWPGFVLPHAVLGLASAFATVVVSGYGFVRHALSRAKAPPKPAASKPGQSRRKSTDSGLWGCVL